MGRQSLQSWDTQSGGHRDWRDQFASLFGQDAASVAKNRSERNLDGTVDTTWGDILWARSNPEMNYQAERINQAALKNSDAGTRVLSEGGKVDHTSTAGNLAREVGLIDARNLSGAQGADRQQLAAMTNLGEIVGAGEDAKRRTAKKDQEDLITLRQAPGRQQAENQLTLGKDTNQISRDKISADERRFLAQMEIGRADNAANRLQEIRLMQMKSDADERRYQQDREYYEQDKQQAALAVLVASLFNLGGAFTI